MSTLLFAALLVSAGDDLTPLLDRIAASSGESGKAYDTWDYTVSIDTVELDGDGKAVGTDVMEVRHSHAGGKVHDELVKHLHDGKDVTASDKKDHAGDADKGDAPAAGFGSPFDADSRAAYTFTRLAPGADGHARIRFVPKKSGDDTMTGSAVVDEASGRLIAIHMQPTNPPVLVSHMDVKMEFGGKTALGPVIDKIVIDAEVGIAFVKKHFRATTSLSQWTAPH
jgi:hypothetical protein